MQLKLHRNKNKAVSSNFESNLKEPAWTKLGRLALNWRQSLKIYVVLLLSCKHSNYIHYVVKFFLKNHSYLYFKCLSVDVVFGDLFTILYIWNMQQGPLFKNEEVKTNRHTSSRDVFKENPGLKSIFFCHVWP